MLVVVNSDQEIRSMIESAFAGENAPEDGLRFLENEAEVFDTLNFELPEIVIVNFSDSRIPVESMFARINKDQWLMSCGIVGILSPQQDSEEALYEKYKACNVLTFLETYRIRSHLRKTVSIIKENYQIIFQKDFSNNLTDMVGGSFTIDNDILSVSLYAGIAATILAQRGLMQPDNKMRLQLALEELIVNAIEHGNCAISYEEKTKAMAQGLSVVDLVAKKCENPRIGARRVDFQWEIQNEETSFTITDEGDGFDVKAHLAKIADQDLYSQHGRGIMMASKLAHGLKYNARGNRVTATIRNDHSVEHEVPAGFDSGSKIVVKQGETVLREGERGNFFYYIISGKYNVYHNDMLVGTLTPQDIFMGEMAFILNEKRSASVIAVTEGKLVRLTRKTLVTVIKSYPQYGLFLTKLMAKRLVRSNQIIAQNQTKTAV
jgi:anti-sigma regulatory factor (Ser/Thr protein kinase)